MEPLRKLCEWLVHYLPLPQDDGLYFQIHCKLAAWAMFGFGKVELPETNEELPF